MSLIDHDPLLGSLPLLNGAAHDEPALTHADELVDDVAHDRIVFLVDSDTHADVLRLAGLPATFSAALYGDRWPGKAAEQLHGARVAIVPGNSAAARAAAGRAAEHLFGASEEVRIVTLPGLQPGQGAAEWLRDCGSPDDLVALAEQAPVYGGAVPWEKSEAKTAVGKTPAPRVSKFGRLPFHRLDEPGPEISYLIDDMLTTHGKSIVAGASMSGKSFFAIGTGFAIATAANLFGHKIMTPGLVVYQAGEGAMGVKKRMRAYRKHFGLDPAERVPFELLQAAVDLYHPEADTAPLIEEIKWIASDYPDTPLRVVIIDTLATATGGADENSGKDMGAVMANIDRIRRECGCAVMLVHHLNAGGVKLRGHTSIFANIDEVIMVACNEITKVRTATLTKQKDGEAGEKFNFELMRVILGQRDDGKEISSCVCLPLGEKELARKAVESEGYHLIKKEEVRIFAALLKALDRYGRLDEPGEEHIGVTPGMKMVEYTAWRDVYAELNPEENGEKPSEGTIGQRWRNNTNYMLGGKVIGVSVPWLWWTGKPVKGFPETQRRPKDMPITANSDPISSQTQINEELTF